MSRILDISKLFSLLLLFIRSLVARNEELVVTVLQTECDVTPCPEISAPKETTEDGLTIVTITLSTTTTTTPTPTPMPETTSKPTPTKPLISKKTAYITRATHTVASCTHMKEDWKTIYTLHPKDPKEPQEPQEQLEQLEQLEQSEFDVPVFEGIASSHSGSSLLFMVAFLLL